MKNILLAITGSIAAYKSAELTRLFVKANCNVKVIMTSSAKEFVHPNTFAALSGNPVYDDLFSDPMLHIDLAKWADVIVIAPASANVISRLAQGSANDLLTTICLATRAPRIVVPAMNKFMWENLATQDNLKTLSTYGYQVMLPAHGEQACGDIGLGRMPEPEEIYDFIMAEHAALKDLIVVITAGPTQEKIDPVRFISNFSSGKMGYALAEAFQQQGAKVILISGPTHLEKPLHCEFIAVNSTEEMLNAVKNNIIQANIFISAAAVCDYKPAEYSTQKIKKSAENLSLELCKTPDILKLISELDHSAFVVGFCAETNNLIEHAKVKVIDKKLNAIVGNLISNDGYPFNSDSNEVVYINCEGNAINFENQAKHDLAKKLAAVIVEEFENFSCSVNV